MLDNIEIIRNTLIFIGFILAFGIGVVFCGLDTIIRLLSTKK